MHQVYTEAHHAIQGYTCLNHEFGPAWHCFHALEPRTEPSIHHAFMLTPASSITITILVSLGSHSWQTDSKNLLCLSCIHVWVLPGMKEQRFVDRDWSRRGNDVPTWTARGSRQPSPPRASGQGAFDKVPAQPDAGGISFHFLAAGSSQPLKMRQLPC